MRLKKEFFEDPSRSLDLGIDQNVTYDDLKAFYGPQIVAKAIDDKMIGRKHFVVRDIARACQEIKDQLDSGAVLVGVKILFPPQTECTFLNGPICKNQDICKTCPLY